MKLVHACMLVHSLDWGLDWDQSEESGWDIEDVFDTIGNAMGECVGLGSTDDWWSDTGNILGELASDLYQVQKRQQERPTMRFTGPNP